MNIGRLDLTNHIIAPLIVAIICSVGAWAGGAASTRWQFHQRIEAAPRIYVEELDRLIQRAVNEGAERALLNARAIVSARNSLRSSLVTISSQLDSEIDRLAGDIGEAPSTLPAGTTVPKGNVEPDPRVVYETIEVLQEVWPAKKVQIEVEMRKILAEMALDPFSVSKRESQ